MSAAAQQEIGGGAHQDHILDERVEALAQAIYLFAFRSTLMLVRDVHSTLFTNDIGYTVGPGPTRYDGCEIFFPLNRLFRPERGLSTAA